MLQYIKELFLLLNADQKRQFVYLQFLVVLMAFLEIIGIASVGPFMAIVAEPDLIQKNEILNYLNNLSGDISHTDFLFFLGVCVLAALTISSLVSMYTFWRLSVFGAQVGSEFADRLYTHYLRQNWLFHSQNSSSKLVKHIATESVRLSDLIIQPLMHMNARLVLAFAISLFLFLFDSLLSIIAVIFFPAAYVLIFLLFKRSLYSNGKIISDITTNRFRLMNDGFGGIKEIILLDKQNWFTDAFRLSGYEFAKARASVITVSNIPRYLVELVAFGSVIALVLFLIVFQSQQISHILPVLSVFALAGFKLLPALQKVYRSISQIKGNIAAYEAVRGDLLSIESQSQKTILADGGLKSFIGTRPEKYIELDNVSFTYPEKLHPVLEGLSLKIPVNSVVGIVGPSGSGKSTVLDVLTGLIKPDKGRLIVDGHQVDDSNLKNWHRHVSFVSQSIFLTEGTIAENVAFGIHSSEINFKKVRESIELADLDEFISTLDKGIDTKVGERGVQLSGGQRQRIGIARALYRNSSVLVFDEATSALDSISEKNIMHSIQNISENRTIIMVAHRIKTVRNCDLIFHLKEGKVTAFGDYESLVKDSLDFRKLAGLD